MFYERGVSMGKNSQYRHLQLRKYIVSLACHAEKEEPIPSERVLAEMFHTTRETVRVSLTRLVEEKYLLRYPRRGYFVNPAMSNAYMRKRRIVGLMIYSGEHAFYDEGSLRLIREVCDEAIQRGWLLQFVSTSRESLVSDLCNTKLDGLVWLHGDCASEAFEKVASGSTTPMVGLFNERKPGRGSFLYLDHYHEFYRRTEYLLSCGCRRIVTVAYNADVARGYMEALRDHNIPFEKELLIKPDSFADTLEDFYFRQKPDGFSLRFRDVPVLTDFALAHSLQIPEDFQVIMDDFKLERNFTHTVKPVKKVVQALCRKLELLMDGKKVPQDRTVFQWTICKGSSTKETENGYAGGIE